MSQVFGADFQDEVESRVKSLVAMPPLALQQSKRLIRSHRMDELREINRKESALLEELWIADECMQAALKFSSSRK